MHSGFSTTIYLVLALSLVGCPQTRMPPTTGGAAIKGEPLHISQWEWPTRDGELLELDDTVIPTSYDLELDLSSGKVDRSYAGRIRIALDIKVPTSVVRLSAVGLVEIGGFAAQAERTSDVSAVRVREASEQIEIQLSSELVRGRAALELVFQGKPSDLGIISRGTEIFTQFEPIYARRAFPCFDVPRFRTPWKLHLIVDEGTMAYSNGPLESVDVPAAGRRRFNFRETSPLPSYLVAFAAGNLRSVKIAGQGQAIPMQLITTEHTPPTVAAAAEQALAQVRLVEEYLGAKIPFPKQDIIAIPGFMLYGMENPGLISIADHLLPRERFEKVRDREFLKTVTHELAHLWFGDSLAIETWNDLWLSESLADWLATRIVDSTDPRQRERTMQRDALRSAKPMDAGFASLDEFRESWDLGSANTLRTSWSMQSSWDKGSALLTMLEGLLGEDRIQEGLRLYVSRHRASTVTGEDLAVAMSEAAHRDLRPILRSFVTQPGVPIVSGTLDCSGSVPAVLLSQKRFRRFRDRDRTSSTLWDIPVCVRYSTGDECFRLSAPTQRFDLGAAQCPSWIHINRGGVGYYRTSVSEENALALAQNEDSLSVAELTNLAYSLRARIESGQVRLEHAFQVFTLLSRSKSPEVVLASIAGFEAIAGLMVSEVERQEFATSLNAVLGQPAIRVLREVTEGNLRELGSVLIPFIAGAGGNREVRAASLRIVRNWLDDPGKYDSELGYLFGVALQADDQTLVRDLMASKELREPVARYFKDTLENPHFLRDGLLLRTERFDAGRFDVMLRGTDENGLDLTTLVAALGGVGPDRSRYGLCTKQESSDLAAFVRARAVGSTDQAQLRLRAILEASIANIDNCSQLRRHYQLTR